MRTGDGPDGYLARLALHNVGKALYIAALLEAGRLYGQEWMWEGRRSLAEQMSLDSMRKAGLL